MLHYHSKALQLIGAEPQVATDAAEQIAIVEQRIGRPLPASPREWYSLDEACELLERFSNGDPPVALADLGRGGLVARDLLVFRHENQGVCAWAILLDGSDDPPVVVDYDSSFQAYQPCANTFSEYVYACVWDWGLVLKDTLSIQAQNGPMSGEALDFLRRAFQAGLVTHGWPGHTQYRFFSADQQLLIWAADDQADWWLAADSQDALFRLAKKLWFIDDVGHSLWSDTAAGQSILGRARDEA